MTMHKKNKISRIFLSAMMICTLFLSLCGNVVLAADGDVVCSKTADDSVYVRGITGVAIGILLAAAIVVVIIVLKKKKEKAVQVNQTCVPVPQLPIEESGKTEMLMPNKSSGETQSLWGSSNVSGNGSTYICLTDVNDPQKSFRARIENAVTIGKKTGDIIIDYDSSVSGSHCEIIRKGNLYYINDLNSTNGTFYEGVRIYSETPIMSNGEIGIGRQKFKVTMIEE